MSIWMILRCRGARQRRARSDLRWGSSPISMTILRKHERQAARPPSSFLSPLLQLERFLGRRVYPDVDFLPRRQNDGHRFRMDRPDLFVQFGRRSAKMSLAVSPSFPDGGPARPDAGEEGQRPGLVEGEPNRRAGAVRQHLVLGKTRPRHHAAVLDSEPAWSGRASGMNRISTASTKIPAPVTPIWSSSSRLRTVILHGSVF